MLNVFLKNVLVATGFFVVVACGNNGNNGGAGSGNNEGGKIAFGEDIIEEIKTEAEKVISVRLDTTSLGKYGENHIQVDGSEKIISKEEAKLKNITAFNEKVNESFTLFEKKITEDFIKNYIVTKDLQNVFTKNVENLKQDDITENKSINLDSCFAALAKNILSDYELAVIQNNAKQIKKLPDYLKFSFNITFRLMVFNKIINTPNSIDEKSWIVADKFTNGKSLLDNLKDYIDSMLPNYNLESLKGLLFFKASTIEKVDDQK